MSLIYNNKNDGAFLNKPNLSPMKTMKFFLTPAMLFVFITSYAQSPRDSLTKNQVVVQFIPDLQSVGFGPDGPCLKVQYKRDIGKNTYRAGAMTRNSFHEWGSFIEKPYDSFDSTIFLSRYATNESTILFNVGIERSKHYKNIELYGGIDLIGGFTSQEYFKFSESYDLTPNTEEPAPHINTTISDVLQDTEKQHIGLSGDFGVRYFLTKNLSIGAELNANLLYSNCIVSAADESNRFAVADFEETIFVSAAVHF